MDESMSHVTRASKFCLTNDMSHVAHMKESCRTYESTHVKEIYVMVRPQFWHIEEWCHTYKQGMSHEWDASRCTYKGVMVRPQLWKVDESMSHVTHASTLCPANDMRHVARTNESWYILRNHDTYKGVMARPHLWHTHESMSHVTHVNKLCPTNDMRHVARINESWYDLIFAAFWSPVFSHVWMSQWVLSHVWTSNGVCVCANGSRSHGMTSSLAYIWVNKSCHTFEQVMTHEWNESRPKCKNVMVRPHLWQMSPTGGVERAYNICWAQQSVRFPQVISGHFVLECVISPKYSGTRIIAKTSHSNRLTSEDPEYFLCVY